MSKQRKRRTRQPMSVKQARKLEAHAPRMWADSTGRIKEVAARLETVAAAVAADPTVPGRITELWALSTQWQRLTRAAGDLAAAAAEAATEPTTVEYWQAREREVGQYVAKCHDAWHETLGSPLSQALAHFRQARQKNKRDTQNVGMVLQLRRELRLAGDADRAALAEIKPAGYWRTGTMLFFDWRKGQGAVRPDGLGPTATVTASSFADGQPPPRGTRISYYERPGRPRPRAGAVRVTSAYRRPSPSSTPERTPARGITSIVSGGGGPGTGRKR